MEDDPGYLESSESGPEFVKEEQKTLKKRAPATTSGGVGKRIKAQPYSNVEIELRPYNANFEALELDIKVLNVTQDKTTVVSNQLWGLAN